LECLLYGTMLQLFILKSWNMRRYTIIFCVPRNPFSLILWINIWFRMERRGYIMASSKWLKLDFPDI
jgi:hypothetical protein